MHSVSGPILAVGEMAGHKASDSPALLKADRKQRVVKAQYLVCVSSG